MNNPGKIIVPFVWGTASALLIILLYSFSSENLTTNPEANYPEVMRNSYRIYTLPIPDSASFSGERVPLEQWDVRERLDRELLVNSYWHSNMLLSIKRATRWFPVIEPILAEEGVPDDFKYLSLIESGFIHAVSPSGAVGFWQFLDSTGRKYGLEINDEVDERYNVEKSTRAACAYLKEAYQKLGSWTNAAAAYNMGLVGLQNQATRQQETDYWNLLLNEETSRYVCRILAMKEVMNHADAYGFVVRPQDLYPPFKWKIISIDTSVTDFAAFSRDLGISYKEFKLHNPWLRQSYLKNKTHTKYDLKIPA